MSTLNPKYTNEIILTAGLKSRLSELGYKSQTFEDLIIEVIGKADNSALIEEVKDKVSKISTESLKANTPTFGLGTGSVDAANLTNKAVEYIVDGTNFTYDLTKFKKDLPAGYTFISGGTTITDSTGKNISAKGSYQTLKLNSLPSTVVVTATVKTASGTMNLDRTILVTGDTSTSATLNVKDSPAANTDLFQHEFNRLIAAEIVGLKQKI